MTLRLHNSFYFNFMHWYEKNELIWFGYILDIDLVWLHTRNIWFGYMLEILGLVTY